MNPERIGTLQSGGLLPQDAGHDKGTNDSNAASSRPHPAIWEMNKMLERLGGDEHLLREVANLFLEETPKHLAELRRAVDAGDVGTIARIAHTLKGELGYLDASAAKQAGRVEELGSKCDLPGLAKTVPVLEREVGYLIAEVRKVVCCEAASC